MSSFEYEGWKLAEHLLPILLSKGEVLYQWNKNVYILRCFWMLVIGENKSILINITIKKNSIDSNQPKKKYHIIEFNRRFSNIDHFLASVESPSCSVVANTVKKKNDEMKHLHTFVIQIPGPNIADIMWMSIIIHCASVTSILPNRNVPDTYDCQ